METMGERKMHSQQQQQQPQHPWNYSDEAPNGPHDWPRHFPVGEAQSPINILVDHWLEPATCDGENHEERTPVPQAPQPLHGLLERKLTLRREHLNSVGNDETESTGDADERHLRSPSSSSNEFSSPQYAELEHQRQHPHHKHDHHHHHHYNHHHNNNNHHQLRNHQSRSSRQSTRYCATNKKLFLGYPRYLNTVTLCNTGHGWQVDIPAELGAHTLLAGPHLGEREYRLVQFHAHWGATCDAGSEHLVNGRAYSAELHFVHWNCSEFSSPSEAARHKHGLAVLGVLLQALDGDQHRNKHLDRVLGGLARVAASPRASTSLRDCRLDLKKLFPANRWSYATYEGSLTTPPLSECVDWLVFLEPVTCSRAQLDLCRSLKCAEGAPLVANCRPVQPLNKRTVTIWRHPQQAAVLAATTTMTKTPGGARAEFA